MEEDYVTPTLARLLYVALSGKGIFDLDVDLLRRAATDEESEDLDQIRSILFTVEKQIRNEKKPLRQCGKVYFRTFNQAHKRAGKLISKTGKDWRVYQCHVCNRYHLTSH